MIQIQEAPANVDRDDDSAQPAPAVEVRLQQAAPVLAHRGRYLRKTVSRQIHDSTARTVIEKINELSASRRLTDPRELPDTRYHVDRARLARIGPTDERDLAA